MNAKDLAQWIDSLTQDISFQYKGVWGSICPFSRSNISVSYGEDEQSFDSVDAAMSAPLIAGQSLQDICDHITFE